MKQRNWTETYKVKIDHRNVLATQHRCIGDIQNTNQNKINYQNRWNGGEFNGKICK